MARLVYDLVQRFPSSASIGRGAGEEQMEKRNGIGVVDPSTNASLAATTGTVPSEFRSSMGDRANHNKEGDSMNYLARVGYNTNQNSRAFSSYSISLAETEEPTTGHLISSNVVENNQDVCVGVFPSLREAVVSVHQYTGVPFAVMHNEATGEYYVSRITEQPTDETSRAARCSSRTGCIIY